MVQVTDLLLLRDAAALGTSPEAMHRQARTGVLTRIHPGAYLPTERWNALRPEDQLLARVLAAHCCLRRDPVFTHESAAVVLGIPLLGGLPERPHVLVPPTGPRSTATVRRTISHLSDEHITTTNGIRTTYAMATAIDLAATRLPLGGVVAFADVRSRLGVSLESLEAELEARRPFPGVRRAECALRTSSADCESVLEAIVLARCEDLGFERPEQQRTVATAIGEYRVDFAWDDGQIVLEADGRGKYLDPGMLDGRSTSDAVLAEKRREDAIRAVVRAFGRTNWNDAYVGRALGQTLARLGVPRIRRARALRR